ncbi:MAG: hypothetical protein ING36_13005 [Burkholderiales bacterium]|nr:hypothetical protein [Burkholderiales bacterium]
MNAENKPAKTVSIGFHRDDGDFQLLATLNNNDDLLQARLQTPTHFLTKHTFHDPEKENAAPGNPLWAHTSKRPAGLYLQMWHGRKTKDEELDDWGLIGPTIGPIQSIHFTYASTMNLTFVDGEDTGPLTSTDALRFEEDYLFYDGIFYGDWSVTLIN